MNKVFQFVPQLHSSSLDRSSACKRFEHRKLKTFKKNAIEYSMQQNVLMEGKHRNTQNCKDKSLHLCENNRTDHRDKTNIHTFLIVKLENNIIFKQKQMYMRIVISLSVACTT